jgi:hypothetical protein
MFAQLASSSPRCSIAHSRISRNAVFDWMWPAKIFPLKSNFRVLRLMFSVEMGRLVLLVEHSNDDPEEHGNDRHDPQYTVVGLLHVAARRPSEIDPEHADYKQGSDLKRRWFSGLTSRFSRGGSSRRPPSAANVC